MLFCGLTCFGQEGRGKLLLLKIDIARELKIDKKENLYLVLEVEEDGSVKFNSKFKHVYFNGFHDADLAACIKRDSIEIATSYKIDTYEHENLYLQKYFDLVEENIKSINYLMKLDIKSPLYNLKLKIYYVLMNAHYCKGTAKKRDTELLGIDSEIMLIIDEITFDSTFKISKDKMFDVIKAINFNSFIY